MLQACGWQVIAIRAYVLSMHTAHTAVCMHAPVYTPEELSGLGGGVFVAVPELEQIVERLHAPEPVPDDMSPKGIYTKFGRT